MNLIIAIAIFCGPSLDSVPGFGDFDHCRYDMAHEAVRVGKAIAGRTLDGVLHDGYPA